MVVILTSESLAIEDERLRRAALLAGQSFACLAEIDAPERPPLPRDAAPAIYSVEIALDGDAAPPRSAG
jgi:hypothetical protein